MQNKNLFLIGGTGLLIIILIAFLVSRNGEDAQDVTQQKTATTTQTASKPTTTPKTTTTKPKTTTVPKTTVPKSATNAYLTALETYKKSGYYIQFFPCQATPGTLTVKKGTKVMLDNRDAKPHVIAVGAAKYTIASYNYAIAPFNTVGTIYVTCDGGGSATVTVQP